MTLPEVTALLGHAGQLLQVTVSVSPHGWQERSTRTWQGRGGTVTVHFDGTVVERVLVRRSPLGRLGL
jgi:hypothetical protein